MAQLGEGVTLYLTDRRAAEAELGRGLVERPGPPVRQTEAQPEQPPFAPGEGVEDGVELLLQEPSRSRRRRGSEWPCPR